MEHINDLLKQGELGGLLVELEKIKRLNQTLRPLLPEAFREDCFVSRIQQGSVTLDVPNGSMATILRYELPTILSELRKDKNWMGLASIKTRVKPPLNAMPEPTSPAPLIRTPISEETRNHLLAMADGFEDEELRLALRALASHI